MLWSALTLLVLASSVSALFNEEEAEIYFDLAARALQKTLEFFDKEVENLNLDAFIGTRLVDGQLVVLKKHLIRQGWLFKKPEKYLQISEMQKLAKYVSDRGLKIKKKKQPFQTYIIEPIISKGFWDQDYPSILTNSDLVTTPLYRFKEAMEEGNSDYCLSEIFGRSNISKPGQICNISNSCWVLMTSPGYTAYSLTHEVLYLEIGIKFGCHKQMNNMITFYQQKSVNDLLDGFCANILQEAQQISWHNFFWAKQDLFMEQAALCGIIGYKDFFKPAWLKKIISWQNKNGCYKELIPNDIPKDDTLREKKQRRNKREEKILPDGCLSHKTTVAAAALVNYLRYIFEDMNKEQTDK